MTRKNIKWLFLLAMALAGTASAASDSVALQTVQTQVCRDGKTVDQYLDHKLSSSHRSLGWRVFSANDGYDVERAFLVSKSAELRYRWRVDGVGQVRAVTEQAQQLCS